MMIPIEIFIFPFFALLCYWPALNGPFLFDDRDAILHNPEVVGGKLWPLLKTPLGRGLTLASYALQSIWPKTSRSFHLVNILIHAFNGFLCQRVLLSLGYDIVTADRGAILYICLPFAANTVSYITGRAAMLSASFGLAGIWAIVAGYPGWSLICLLWAIYAKEDGAGYIFTFAGLMVLSGRYWWILSFAILLPYFYFTDWNWKLRSLMRNNGDQAMRRGGLPGSHRQPWHAVSVLAESILAMPAWAIGWRQAPYQGSGIPVPSTARALLALSAGLAGLALFVAFPGLRLPLILIALGPWLLYAAIPAPDQLIEYRYYSATLGWAILGTMALEYAPAPASPWLWAGAIGYCASNTAWQAHAWSNDERFWNASIRRGQGEKSRAWQELGAQYKQAMKLDLAVPCFQRALELNPNLAPAMRNLAWIWVQQRKLTEAVDLMRQCTARCPEHGAGWEELGYMLELQSKSDEAESSYRRALELESQLELSKIRLGLMLFRREAYREAVPYFRAVHELYPGRHEYRWNLGWTLKLAGQLDEARQIMRQMPQQVQMTDEMVVPPQLVPQSQVTRG